MLKEYHGIITADGLLSIADADSVAIHSDVPAISFWALLTIEQLNEIKSELLWGDRHRAVYLLNLYASSLGRMSPTTSRTSRTDSRVEIEPRPTAPKVACKVIQLYEKCTRTTGKSSH